MNTPHILNKIEITFWDHAIQLMTESKTVQKLICQAYPYARDPKKASWIPAAIAGSAVFGLGTGIIMGILGISFH